MGLFALLAMIAFGSIGTLGYLAMSHLPGLSGNVVDMSWMPENVDGFAYFEPAKIAATPFTQAIEKKFPESISGGLDGVAAANIDSILIGFWEDDGPPSGFPSSLPIPSFGFTGRQRSTDFLWITRLNKDEPSALDAEPKNGEYNGLTLYGSRGKLSCMPDSRTILLGSERSLKAAIDRNGREFTHWNLRFVRGTGNVVLAAADSSSSRPSTSTKPATSFPSGSPFGASRKVTELLDQHTRGGYLAINIATRADFSGSILCHDDAGATLLDQELQTVLNKGKEQIETLKSIPPLAALSGPLTTLLNSLAVARDGATIFVSGNVEQSLIDAIPSNALPPASSFGPSRYSPFRSTR